MIKVLTDIKTYIALLLGALESFYGPTYPLIGSLILLGLGDVVVGIWRSKKRGEKFQAKKLWAKFSQVSTFLVALSASIVSDRFFQHYGLRPLWVAESVCSAYGVWQFLHILENLGHVGLPIVENIKDLLRKKISKEENNNVEDPKE